eukprot:2876587-Rhodomonas_salina.2
MAIPVDSTAASGPELQRDPSGICHGTDAYPPTRMQHTPYSSPPQQQLRAIRVCHATCPSKSRLALVRSLQCPVLSTSDLVLPGLLFLLPHARHWCRSAPSFADRTDIYEGDAGIYGGDANIHGGWVSWDRG